MATSEDVRIQAQLLSSIQIDKTTCYEWIKDQIQNIVNENFRAGKLIIEDFETTEKFEIYKPKKTLVVVDRLVDANGQQTTEFVIQNDGIHVYAPGKYKLLYFAQPEPPETINHQIDLPVPYVNALKFYIAARIRARLFGQSDNDAVSFFKEYSTAIESAEKMMNKRDSRRKRMPPGRRTL